MNTIFSVFSGLSIFSGVAFSLALVAPGLALAAEGKTYDVEIAFSDSLEKRMEAINRVEQERERRFRETGTDVFNPNRTSSRHDKTLFHGTEWANQALIDDVEDYTVENLLAAMVQEDLRRAAPEDFDGKVRLTLERLFVTNHSVATLASASSWAKGKIEILDPNTGNARETHDVTANLKVNFTAARDYKGEGFAFFETDRNIRVGPTLAYFVYKSLGKVVPKENLAEPVMVVVGPQRRIITN